VSSSYLNLFRKSLGSAPSVGPLHSIRDQYTALGKPESSRYRLTYAARSAGNNYNLSYKLEVRV
jgi:hypothetical protein